MMLYALSAEKNVKFLLSLKKTDLYFAVSALRRFKKHRNKKHRINYIQPS